MSIKEEQRFISLYLYQIQSCTRPVDWGSCLQWHLHRLNAINGLITALYSPPIYTHLYGYKLRMKFYLNGVRSGIGKHVGLFVQMMQSEYVWLLTKCEVKMAGYWPSGQDTLLH